jgi:hypothetical protein
VDAVAPSVAEGFDLLRFTGDVVGLAVLHVAAGSGPHWARYWRSINYVPKERVERCITLSLSEMLQENFLELTMGERIFRTMSFRRDYSNDRQYTLGIELHRLSPSEIRLWLINTSQQVYLRSTPLNFGGVRWGFRCPGCGGYGRGRSHEAKRRVEQSVTLDLSWMLLIVSPSATRITFPSIDAAEALEQSAMIRTTAGTLR